MMSRSASLTNSPCHGGHAVVEGAVGVDRVEHGQALGPADGGVVLAEGGGEVDDARAVVGADEVGRDDPPGARRRRGASRQVERAAGSASPTSSWPFQAVDELGALGQRGPRP